MKDAKLQNLRRLAKRYGITFKVASDEWPAAHAKTFNNIKNLGYQKFDTYSESVSIRSQDEPWTEQTKHRAKWLVDRAAKLFGQQQNESGWRFGLENDILRRFSVEVAWCVSIANFISWLIESPVQNVEHGFGALRSKPA
jgi:hypothetical protein